MNVILVGYDHLTKDFIIKFCADKSCHMFMFKSMLTSKFKFIRKPFILGDEFNVDTQYILQPKLRAKQSDPEIKRSLASLHFNLSVIF